MARNRPARWLQARRAGAATDWLARALGRAGAVPDGHVAEALAAGRVRVDGVVVREPFAPVPAAARVLVDEEPASLAWRTRILVFHKPRGLVVAGTDADGGGTVFAALRAALPPPLRAYAWHAVGRLDRDTTGLLLFTNDERFVEHATAPATHLPKRYVAHVDGTPDEARLEPLRRGLTLDDGPTRPAPARLRAPGVVELVLTEGRNRQVRRMLDAVRLPVTALHREAIGDLVLDVPAGGVRALDDEETTTLLGWTVRAGDPVQG